MAVTVQMQFASVVTEIYQDAFVGSSIENGTTVRQFDLRRHNFHQELGTQATLCWPKASYHVDVQELSTFPNPMLYRFILAQGSYLNDKKQRIDFTPAIKGVYLPAYEPQRAPVVLLSRGGLWSQSQARCGPFCRAVPDSYSQVVDQTLDGCHWLQFTHTRGDAAAVAGPRPSDGVSHGRLLPFGDG